VDLVDDQVAERKRGAFVDDGGLQAVALGRVEAGHREDLVEVLLVPAVELLVADALAGRAEDEVQVAAHSTTPVIWSRPRTAASVVPITGRRWFWAVIVFKRCSRAKRSSSSAGVWAFRRPISSTCSSIDE